MALPIKAVRRPAVLTGQANGRLPASLLAAIAMPGGGSAVVLAAVAVKWSALLADAARAGFPLAQVGDYRPYADQERIFRDRYTTSPIRGAQVKTWHGARWYQRPGTAVAATPGTSNHGWGLALDLCMSGGGSISDAAVAWLCANAARFGISAEIQSEDWHWRPYDGDAMTPAVLHYQSGGDDVASLVRHKDGKAVYVSNYVTCRWVQGADELDKLKDAGLGDVKVVADLAPYGFLVGPAYDGDPVRPEQLTTRGVLDPAVIEAAVKSAIAGGVHVTVSVGE